MNEKGSIKLLSTLSEISAGIKKSRSSGGHHLFGSLTVRTVTNISEDIERNPRKQLELEKQSEKYRNEGNTYFKKAMYMHAYQLYTRSIASALHGPVCALAYANRSAALFYVARFEECLLDIAGAIANGYQENLLYKLYLRQARSLKYLGKNFIPSVNRSIKAIEVHNQDEVKTLKEVVESEMNLPAPVANPSYGEYYSGDCLPTLSYGVSAEVPCFSSAISVAYNKEQGRYLVANRDLEIGDVLIVEDPIATVVDVDKTNKVCCRCFQISYTLNPCEKCRQFMYCSKECKKLHWNDGHKDECKLFNQVLALSLDMQTRSLFMGFKKTKFTLSCLVLSLITHGLGLEKMEAAVTKNKPMRQSYLDPRTRGFDNQGKFTFSLEALLSLTDNFNKLTKDEKHTIVYYASQAVLYTPAWKNLDIDLKYGLTALYIKLFLITVFNYKPLTMLISCDKTEVMAKRQTTFRRSEVGFALYLASSLINHSCSPNVYKVYYGTKVVYFASKSVKKGDQLNEAMYLTYLNYKRQTRQEVLQEHFRFTCKCVACKDNWPTMDKLSADESSGDYFPPEINQAAMLHVEKTGGQPLAFVKSVLHVIRSGFPENYGLISFTQ